MRKPKLNLISRKSDHPPSRRRLLAVAAAACFSEGGGVCAAEGGEAANRDATPRSPAAGFITNRSPQLLALPLARELRRVTRTL